MAEVIGPRLYSCCNCRNHVALHDDVISKAFQGKNGRAFLFSHAMNIVVGPKEDRQLRTGLHTVADVYCSDCREVLGWKYVRAYEETQKYKEGKFVLEKSNIAKENW
ncbi:protein yippee-like At4g27745 isoform X1 [Camellia sinensis]|uniref:protein yippee-like At4g27745 isoform X1 n=1 Tax=Camellia sinensis TaxID=4442 RepID=UPI0010358BA8|nr:protein yippee-like At4g27745 isoform X1 [Camellia sinensis]XP_028060085.1 protein yippee-like At4g27745 isoform X1 [Camellia sinensis]XP_028060086.1 protein yippee-like At4g27745 isoform X1 [Camellia sinensis]XP_028060087.1 protein yippee-like At4g27745 isoform X1 [Camellia sinensis]XP_028060088.1 protein yippee-like At4g27745 isoform X1 [Camellia sinensis]XP_028060089.1 protein yippee-like At4g27745 isoform X1 [Camellia sinensis]XP_028060091.1 protein yippee-like At4g27745 isoform X1 [Ca